VAPKVVIQLVEELKNCYAGWRDLSSPWRRLLVLLSLAKECGTNHPRKFEISRLAICANNINSDMVIERLPPCLQEFV